MMQRNNNGNSPKAVAETYCGDYKASYRRKKLNSEVFFVSAGAISIGT